MPVILTDSAPDTATFIKLREQCGWGKIEPHIAERAIANSLLWMSANIDAGVIGCVRLIGDGALNLYVQDLIVEESHRGRGIGSKLMQTLLSNCEKVLPIGATIGLMSVTGKEPFYEAFGFQTRPVGRLGAGMTMSYDPL